MASCDNKEEIALSATAIADTNNAKNIVEKIARFTNLDNMYLLNICTKPENIVTSKAGIFNPQLSKRQ